MDTKNLRYTQTHEWIEAPKEGQPSKVGITQHAQEEISDVVFVELPKVGKTLEVKGEAAVIESVKSAFSIYAPASGEVVEINEQLSSDPALINGSPTDQGWIYALKLSDPKALDALMSEEQYEAWLTKEKSNA